MTFNHPPINLIDSVMIGELGDCSGMSKATTTLPYSFSTAPTRTTSWRNDISDDNRSRIKSPPAGPTGYHPWLDVLVRLSRLPAVTISAIRGRARGAGSEFALATDIRFASRERALLGQFEIGVGAIPGGGPASRLPGLVGRGRALEILVGGEDSEGESGLPGTREGQLVELAGRAGLVDVESSTLTVTLRFDTFGDWWEPYTFGVGPAGAYVGRLSEADRAALAARCAELLGPPPFDVRASAWAVRARPPAG